MSSPTPMVHLPTCMAVPVYVAEEVAVGRCVFQNFIHEEFEEEGVPDEILAEVPEEVLEEEIVPDRTAASSGYVDENLANALEHIGVDSHEGIRQIGVHLRELANDFAKSNERKRLKKEADKVDVVNITYDGFYALCEEVFLHGFTRENIIALFFFCADVLIRCVKSEMKDIGIKLFKWALKYVVDRVCAWVAKHGGWEKAIKNTFTAGQIAAMGAGAVVIVAVGGFIFYKWIT
ncbi:hypothetical protein AVEN_236480-1 [Araneus ventricosus]|uniref:Bcl-2 Bcl-2 homology region 1-3 domain-containing protein n=1 Tax=Araneus ventricosus TaxID=182803 RepID=A0A4Y2LIQ7_ARAVE|nr:hypothetical protein AVEN_236480-1 [Araneus ventricosus]